MSDMAGNGLTIRCEELVHIYRTGDVDVVAVRGVDLDVDAGERLALLLSLIHI